MPIKKGKNLSSTFSKVKSLDKNDHKREEQTQSEEARQRSELGIDMMQIVK